MIFETREIYDEIDKMVTARLGPLDGYHQLTDPCIHRLHEKLSDADRGNVIRACIAPGHLTLMTREYGRETDFVGTCVLHVQVSDALLANW